MITDEDYSQFLTNVLSVVEEELQKGFRPVAFLLDVCDPCALAIASEWCDLPLLSEIVGIPMLHSAVPEEQARRAIREHASWLLVQFDKVITTGKLPLVIVTPTTSYVGLLDDFVEKCQAARVQRLQSFPFDDN